MLQTRTSGLKRVHFEDNLRYTGSQLPKSILALSTRTDKHTYCHRSTTISTIVKPFESSALAKQALREIKIQSCLSHENLVSVADVQISAQGDLIFIQETMWNDLASLLSHGPLSAEVARHFTYQILRGLKYTHSFGFAHCDLEPRKILLKGNFDVKIGIFGLNKIQSTPRTYHVSTNNYSAPEVILGQSFSAEADSWSVACVLLEMLQKGPVSAEPSIRNQPLSIPDAGQRLSVADFAAFVEGITMASTCTSTDYEESVLNEFVMQLLVLDPSFRTNVEEALSHPYLASHHDPLNEPCAEKMFDWYFGCLDLPKRTWRSLIFNEIVNFKKKKAQAMPCLEFSGSKESGFDYGLAAFFEMPHP